MQEIRRKSKEYIYNYVDRVRFAESSFPDYKCPSRGSGWRHNKSISHLDLATSCHSAAAGLSHWSSSHQTRHHQLRHSRSLDYNHIDRCKDALDIAEYYWRVEPEPEIYDEEEEEEIIEAEQQQHQQQQQQQQLKYVSEHHLTQHYRDFKCADENYHHSTNNIYQSNQQQQQQLQQQQQQHQQPRQQNLQQLQSNNNNNSITSQQQQQQQQQFEFASDSCSLRRSRSLAVIREETFSDLQISSSNGSRRSQLIPRARLVNRGYFRERERLICGNNKYNHHHHHTSREKLTTNCNCNNSGCNTSTGVGVDRTTAGVGVGGSQVNNCYCQDLDEQSNESVAETCDSHQQQLLQHKQQQQQTQHLHYHPHYLAEQQQNSNPNDYYEHLKRLDKLALGLVSEQLHPWHNDKSDLESLNSDYFKNSLHQSSDHKQHLHLNSHQQQLEFESYEQAIQLLAQDKPRIYQSRRQKRCNNLDKNHKFPLTTNLSGGESCPENSQSSVFPETTTSNSDDQTDSASLSEQEYDITKIEEIFQKTQIEGDEESYEIISLTTTTRTRFETTEDAEGEEEKGEEEEVEYRARERDRLLEEQINKHRFFNDSDTISQEDLGDQELEDKANETEESNRHTTTDTEIEGTLKRARAVSDNLQKIIAYDSVYLSSEESSDSTLIDIDNCDTSLEVNSLCTCIDEVETLLHISIEDAIYEPQAKQHKFEVNCTKKDSPQTQQETLSFVETVNTKIQILDHCQELEDSKPLYTQILKIEHTPCSNSLPQQQLQPSTNITTAGVTSSAASKPKILSVVEKRKLKRYSDSAYSSNVSDSSDKALTPPTTDSSLSSTYTLASHLKRQVAEPLYIPLKSNLSDNQYHSLPDVNIGQCLKVSESIDAQLRSSYNLDNYCSLDQDTENEDCHITNESVENITSLIDDYNTKENKNVNCVKHEEVNTCEEIYDSIKRFGRAHQQYKQKESEEEEQEQLVEPEKEDKDSWSSVNSLEIEEDPDTTPVPPPETPEYIDIEDSHIPEQSSNNNYSPNITHDIEISLEYKTFKTKPLQPYFPPPPNYDSLEKSKDAPGIEIENFSQQIERRAKEIRASGRRNTKLQQIEFANRAKFRLENTLSHYEDYEEQQQHYTKELKSNNKNNLQQQQLYKNSLFRIVVTDAQNNIIEEDSIESLESKERELKEQKENFNLSNIKSNIRLENSKEELIVKFSKERLKEKQALGTGSIGRSGGSLRRVPSKHKRQQYPITAATNQTNQHLSVAEAKKLLLSPKSKERRVLSNQIYRARPVKVITTTTTTTTTTTSDSFRRNKVKHQTNKMSRPQILQVIDNKRKLENVVTNNGNNNSTATSTNQIFHSSEEGNQVENEYLKKVDAVRCYWSKLVNSEQKASEELREIEEKEQKEENKLPNLKSEEVNEQQKALETNKEQIFYMKQSKKTNDMENLNESQLQQQQTEQRYEEKKQFILGAQTKHKSYVEVDNRVPAKMLSKTLNDNQQQQNLNQDDYCSFMPSIEIVELEGDKKATIVSAVPTNLTNLKGHKTNNVDDDDDADNNDANEPQFDHIRYKVLKSQQLLRSNVLARNKKEAQFDGLIQYLQEYSFQELLSNNNVVIVEPVRTKIERPMATANPINTHLTKDAGSIKTTTTTQQLQKGAKCKQRNINSNVQGSNVYNGSGGIKRHFFYQPVRVNRELYEEELPNPDTVRNVRKFFEEHILPTPGQGLLTKSSSSLSQQQQQENNGNLNLSNKQTSPKSRRARKYRYLTIDTSYGHAATVANKHSINSPQRKWDTSSLSSGISSGDLSSPCECNDMENNQKHEQETITNQQETKIENPTQNSDDNPKPVHVQDMVRKHNSSSTVRKTRTSAFGVPVRASGIRPRSAYGSLHKSSKSSNYRDIYEYNIKHAQRDSEAAEDGDADEDEDDNDLFGDIDDDEDETCDTYYVSNDVLRKIRECGSSVTYYGGRVVQTSANSAAASVSNPLETYGCGHNNNGNIFNNTLATTNNTTKNPTMMTQTQTRARVREIETCCNTNNTNTAMDATVCSTKASNNECQHHHPHQFQGKQLEQKKLHLIKNHNNVGCSGKMNETQIMTQQPSELKQNHVKHKAQGYQNNNDDEDDKLDHNTGGVGITFKLVKSNSCSSRLELAGATDYEPEETEVVRKMVHHFEATKAKYNKPINKTDTTLTINNQTCCQDGEIANHIYNQRTNDELLQNNLGIQCGNRESQVIDEKQNECGIKLVTVNNHINIAKGIEQETLTVKEIQDFKEDNKKKEETNVEKLYQTEAKDIFLDNVGVGGMGVGSRKDVNTGTCVKICRNKNVDLAFTFVKQQQQQQPTTVKSSGISSEIGKEKSANNNNTLQDEQIKKDKKLLTYENTLLPTITATTKIVKNSNKMSIGDTKIDEAQNKTNITTKTITNSLSSTSNISNTSSSSSSSTPKPSQIIVPVEIHCVDTSKELKNLDNTKHLTSSTNPNTNPSSTSPSSSSVTTQSSKGVSDEKSFVSLSTTSSVTSVIDKTVVKHYVANDKSIYEKRKYDDIEFEEFEIYDPTKDFEKVIEDEQMKRNNETNTTNTPALIQINNSNTSSLSSNTSKASTTSTSMVTAKSQQTIVTTETETDCYDSLDDKL